MKKKKSKTAVYTVDEFLDHMRALNIVREYQHVTRRLDGGAEEIEIGNDRSFEANFLRVRDYFSQIYADQEEGRNKSVVFMLILTHIAKYRDSYDSENFAVFSDKDDQPSMVSLALFRAAHFHFTKSHYRDIPSEDLLVDMIKNTAREYEKEENRG